MTIAPEIPDGAPYLLISSLGDWLVERGVISREQARLAMQQQGEGVERFRHPLSDLLAQRGAASTSAIWESLRAVKHRLLYLFSSDLPRRGPPLTELLTEDRYRLGSIIVMALVSGAKHLRILQSDEGTMQAVWNQEGVPTRQGPMKMDEARCVERGVRELVREATEREPGGLPFLRVKHGDASLRMTLDFREYSGIRFSLDAAFLTEA